MMTRGFCFALVIALAALVPNAAAKKVICIDGCNSPYVNNHEGWLRAMMVAGDVIQVGGNLQDCLAQVANGDRLVIVAHGTGTGTGFIWGGTTYTGFGGGANQGTNPHPVPAGFGNRMNVTVDFCSCWSARDPDGAGANRPLTNKLRDAMGGAGNGHTMNGFNDLAVASVNYRVTGGTAEQRQAAIDCLTNNTAWMGNPPTNRSAPPPVPNQQSAAQQQVNNCPGTGPAGTITVTITGYKQPVNEAQAPQGGGVGGCECPNAAPFCGFGAADGLATFVPAVDPLGALAMALLLAGAGVYALRKPVQS